MYCDLCSMMVTIMTCEHSLTHCILVPLERGLENGYGHVLVRGGHRDEVREEEEIP